MKLKNRLLSVSVPFAAVIIAFIIGGIIIAALGASPFDAIKFLAMGAFGTASNVATTLVKATPLIFTGLCACFAYRCGVFNLGGEGQFVVGACVSVWAGVTWGMSGFFGIFVCLLLGALAGGIWGAIPGVLKITRGLNEIIVSIMLNYVAILFMGLLYTSLLREDSVPQTPAVAEGMQIPRIFPSVRVTWGILLAIVVGLITHYFLFSTSSGFRLRAVGLNSVASRFNGFSVNKYMLMSFIASGAIAGLGGSVELLATQYRLMSGFGQGFGFDGVAIALIAQLNPLATIFIAYFFAVLRTGATTMQVGTGVPTAVIDIIQAMVIIFAVAGFAIANMTQFQQYFKNKFGKDKLSKKEAA